MFIILRHQRNASQNNSEIPSYTCKNGQDQKPDENLCWRECGVKGTLLHCWWECKLVQPVWKSVWWFLRKLGNNLPQDPTIPLLGIHPKDAQSYYKNMCSTMFIAALFVIARTWKQPRCPLNGKWIKKMWYIYTMEYYTAEKNNDILKFADKWIDLENIILSEVTQTQKEKLSHILSNKWFLNIKQRKSAHRSHL